MIRELKAAESHEVNGARGELSDLVTAAVFLATCVLARPDIRIHAAWIRHGDVANRNREVYKAVLRGCIKTCVMAFGFAEIAGMIVEAVEK